MAEHSRGRHTRQSTAEEDPQGSASQREAEGDTQARGRQREIRKPAQGRGRYAWEAEGEEGKRGSQG